MMEKLRVTVNGHSYDVMVEVLEAEKDPGVRKTAAAPAGQPLTAISGGKAISAPAKSNADGSVSTFKSPMPGTIMDIKVSPGDSVKQGHVLITLEAMKMENELVVERDSIVKEIHVSKGQSVQAGELLISLA